MKQHVDVEQIYKLDEKTKVKLAKLIHENQKWQEWIWEDTAKLLTIGKMIEILANYKQIEIIQGRVWWIMFMDKSLKISSDELCDALWKSVKYVLEED